MPNPSITYTFIAGTSAEAGEVNTNFSDIISSLTDGTKDLTVNTVTTTGAVTTGTTLTSGSTLTVGSTVSSDLTPTTDSTYDLGSASSAYALAYIDDLTVNNNATITNDLTVSNDATVTGEITISGTGTHSVTSQFANEVEQTRTMPNGGTTASAGEIAVTTQATYTNTTSSLTDIFSTDATITTTGRPVMLVLQASSSNGYIDIDDSGGSTTLLSADLRMQRGGSTFSRSSVQIQIPTSSTSLSLNIPLGAISAVDTAPIGSAATYTYNVQGRVTGTNNRLRIFNAELLVFEL